jgi:PBP1b-binding outer membrane lipoprotein LpoB
MKLKIAAVFLTALFLTGCSMENVKSGVAAVPNAIGSAIGSTVDFVTGIF